MDTGEICRADLIPATSAIMEGAGPSEQVHQDAEVGMLIAAARRAEWAMNFSLALPSRAGEMRDTRQLQAT